jgi:hypothetical protein
MTGARVDGWGYKDLDETVGPTAIDCPLSYLDAPHREPVGYAAEWRNRVRRFHAGTSRPQADADARLIAAAPELLAVLVGIERSMGWLVDNPDEPLIMSRSDFDAVRAAIRKATGE